jgi:hypothetical protein
VTKLDKELLAKIANGSGRCYPHEGKYMAQEILEWRKKAEEDLLKTQPIPLLPFP